MDDIGSAERHYLPARAQAAGHYYVVLSGCSGGGKSTLLQELGRRGFGIFEEPGRQIIKEQNAIGGHAVPGGDVGLFAELLVSRSINRMIEAADTTSFVFFDRAIVDVVSHYESVGEPVPAHVENAALIFRTHPKVFLVPPWPEIFRNDEERRHSFEDALASYEMLPVTYARLGYTPVIIPKLPVSARADFVLQELAAA